DRHDADDIEPVAPEETVGLDLDGDHDVPPPLGPLPLETQPRAVLRAGRDRDRQPLFDAHLARPVAGGAGLRRPPPAAAAHGAWPRAGAPSLAEPGRAAPLALGGRR